MNCANCGGGLRPVGNRDYFRCPYCETFHFPTETGDGVATIGEVLADECPVCAERLTLAAIHGHEVSYCQTCRGFLATNGTFGRLVQTRRAEAGSTAPPASPFDPAELKRRIRCPRCQSRMDTHPYHAGGNAVVDTCERCHLIWLDAGELKVIGRFPARERPKPIAPVEATAPSYAFADPAPEIDLFGFRIRLG